MTVKVKINPSKLPVPRLETTRIYHEPIKQPGTVIDTFLELHGKEKKEKPPVLQKPKPKVEKPKMVKVYTNQRISWTEKNDNILKTMLAENRTYREIGIRFGISSEAVRKRVKKLRNWGEL